MITKKSIKPESYDVPATSPYINDAYIGDRKHLASQIMEQMDSWKNSWMLWAPTYYEAIAIMAGRQNVWFNPQSRSLEPVLSAYPNQWNEVINVILSKVVTEISRFSSYGPTAQVIPSSGSMSASLGARAAKMILQSNYFDYKLAFQATYSRAALWDIVMGHSFIKTTWDPFGGKAFVEYEMEPDMVEIQQEAQAEGETFDQELTEFLQNPMGEVTGENEERAQKDKQDIAIGDVTAPAPGQSVPPGTMPPIQIPKVDSEGQPVMKKVLNQDGTPKIKSFGYEGCVRKEAISPLNILYDPAVNNFWDLTSLIHTEYKSIADVKATIPNCQDLSLSDRETNSQNPWEMIYKLQVDQNPNGQNQGINVHEFWLKATQDFPQGLRVIIVKNIVRLAMPMDTLEGERLPFSHAFYHDLGTMRGMGLPEVLRGGQVNLNKLYNQWVRNSELFEVPHILMRDDTKFTEIPTNQAASEWRYSGTTPPEPWNPIAMGQSHFQLLNFTDQFIDQISHISKLAEGQVQPNITSAEMMQTALEANYQANNMEMNRFGWMVADSCELELRYIQANANKRILVKFIGQDGRLVVDEFDSTVLRDQFSVTMPPGQAGNNSRAQQSRDLQTFLPLILQGQVDDPQMKTIFIQKVLDYMSWGEETRTISEINRQENYARSWINEVKNSYDNPNFDVKILLQPFIDFKTWKQEIEGVLLDKDEFEAWHMISRNRLMELWTMVVQKITEMQNAAMAQVMNPPMGNPPPAPPGPGAPPPGAPHPPMPKPGMGPGPGTPPPPPGNIQLKKPQQPDIIQRRVPQFASPQAIDANQPSGVISNA